MECGYAAGIKNLAAIVRNLGSLWTAQEAMKNNELLENF
jgi:hypothetical protein